MLVLGIAGSARRDSLNRTLLQAGRDLLPDGTNWREFQGLKAVPIFDEDDEVGPAPASVIVLKELVRDAAAVLIATPEYNASIPGGLKNALDWVSRPDGS